MASSRKLHPVLGHTGIMVTDMNLMVDFYTNVLDLVVTDRGPVRNGTMEVAFLSASPEHHHQLAFASGRPKEATYSTVMQTSFMIDSLDDLRTVRQRALAKGATAMRGVNHGNAWSVYFKDPEGNTVEAYLDTPYHVPQPHAEELDLSKSDAEIARETEQACRTDPDFMLRGDFVRQQTKTLA
jgi:catechol 2,3-dioxygenase